MPLPSRLGRFFSRDEYASKSDDVPESLVPNALKSVQWLDIVRAEVGVPIVITSGYRGGARNERVGGSATSDHPRALALDFVPRGITLQEFYRRFLLADNAGRIPTYDQIILYPHTTGHVHVGLGERMRRQRLVVTREADREVYKPIGTMEQLVRRGGATLSILIALAILFLFYLSFRKG